MPSNISVQLTWNNGTPQTAVNFSTTGHSAGDVYLLDAQVSSANAPTSTGAYPWSLTITASVDGNPVTRTLSGTAYVVVSPSNAPTYVGWSIAGVDQLVSVSGGVIYVYGSGGYRVFTGSGPTYTSPANDFGTLVKNGDNTFTYTSKDQWKRNFDTSGNQTTLVDPHNLTLTYTWSGGLLVNVTAPDGGLVTFGYFTDRGGGKHLTSIDESGSRSVVTLNPLGSLLSSLSDVDNSLHNWGVFRPLRQI